MVGAGSEVSPAIREDVRTGLDSETLCRAVCDHLFFFQGRHAQTATRNDHYLAVALRCARPSVPARRAIARSSRLVQATIEGRLPRGIGVTRLRDAPAEWSRQYAMLGLSV